MKLTDKKRQQIVFASVEEFREKGFSGTSMDNVAQRAQVSKRTVYNHFSSKDELFLGIMQHMFALIAETAPSPYRPEEPIEEQLKVIARLKIKLFASDEFIDFSRVVMPEALHSPERMQQALSQISSIESDMDNWFAAAIEDDQLKFETGPEACEKFMGLLKMEAFWPRMFKGKPAPNKKESEHMIKQIIGMFLCYYAVKKT